MKTHGPPARHGCSEAEIQQIEQHCAAASAVGVGAVVRFEPQAVQPGAALTILEHPGKREKPMNMAPDEKSNRSLGRKGRKYAPKTKKILILKTEMIEGLIGLEISHPIPYKPDANVLIISPRATPEEIARVLLQVLIPKDAERVRDALTAGLRPGRDQSPFSLDRHLELLPNSSW